ncbi:hypothetical protein [Piscinibacter sp.]|uniref:hypothetical protein n=1 Tax=Piscinibacter sp. TaxID=1903157 RepID=UPI0035593DCC
METENSEWIQRCVRAAMAHAPRLHPEDALKSARDMHSAWPHLTPEKAAECYFSPALAVASWGAVELS